MEIKLLLRDLDNTFFGCMLSSIVIPVIISILFTNLNYQQAVLFFISQSAVVTTLFLIVLVIQIFYMNLHELLSIELTNSDHYLSSRIRSYPFYSALMLAIFNIAGITLVSMIFYYFARISLEQYIAIWLVVIASTAIHAVAVYTINNYHIDRYAMSSADKTLSGVEKDSYSIKTRIMGTDVIIISLPVILMLVSIYLYDLNNSNIYTRMGNFIIIGVIITCVICLLSVLKKRFLNIKETTDSGLLKISKYVADKYGITGREMEIINMMAKGYRNTEICNNLEISVKTVKNHIYNIYQKTSVDNRVKLINLLQNQK